MLRDRAILIFSILFFIIISFFLYWYAPDATAHFRSDSIRYDFIAHHFSFIKDVQLEMFGYPLFLGLVYKLFGCSVGFVILVQVLLSLISLFLLRKIVGTLGTVSAQTFITLLWVVNLGFIVYSQLLLLEIVLAFLYVWFIERSITFYEKPSLATIAQAGIVLGLSILFRPAALFYAFYFAPFLLFISKKSVLYRLKAGIIFIVIFYIPLLVYMSANYWMFGKFVLCPVMNVNLFLFFYPKLLGAFRQEGIMITDVMNDINVDIAQNNISLKTQINLIKVAFQQPFLFVKVWLINMVKSCIGLYQTEWKLFFEQGDQCSSFFSLFGTWFAAMRQYIQQGTGKYWLHVLGWYEVIYVIVEYIFVAIGAYWLLLKRKTWLFFFAASFIIYFVLITGPDGSGRFRMMIEPWLLVLASLGLAIFFGTPRKKQKIFDWY